MTEKILDFIKMKYGVVPEHPWKKYPENKVFRHSDNKKWFALMMEVQRTKLGFPNKYYVSVINLKVDDLLFRDIIIQEDGIFPAYHMNKQHWITVMLDGTVPCERVIDLIEMSFLATASARKKEKLRPPKEWIIPANPKYYDIEHAFDAAEVIDWKQGAGIKKGDTVFMYVAAPVSAVLYECSVLETDIPYRYSDRNLTIKALMKIKCRKRFDRKRFTFEILKEKYGIYAIRGPRGIPHSLSAALKKSKII